MSARASRLTTIRDWSRAVAVRTQSAEEYLEAIFKLQRGAEPVTVKRLAVELGVAPPSVSEMLGRLRAAGLVEEPAEGRGIALTEEGNVEGATLVRRHRLSERFLVDYLDMPWDAVHEEACKLEHVLSPEVEARLAEQLGNPLTCPHGHAIPGGGRLARRRGAAAALGARAGRRGRHRLHHRGEERPAALPRVTRPAPRHARRRRERGALQRPAARPRRRLAVRPRPRGDGQDHGPRLTPVATTLRQSRREAAGACPAGPPVVVCLAGNPNVGKSSLFNSLTGSSRETANCAGVTRRRLRRLHAVGGQAHRDRRPAGQLLARRARRRPAGGPHGAARAGGPGSSSPSPTRPTWRGASTCRCSSSTSATASSSPSTSRTRRAGAGGCRTPRCSRATSASPWCPPSRRAARASRSWRRPSCASRPATASATTAGTPLPPETEERLRGARLPHRDARRRRRAGDARRARRARRRVRRARGRRRRHARARPRRRRLPHRRTTRASRSRSPRRGTPRRARWRRPLRTPASPPTAGGASRRRRGPASRS